MGIYLKIGTVNAGKSMSLLRDIHSYESKGLNVLVCKSHLDTRDPGFIVSRAMSNKRECIMLTEEYSLRDAFNNSDRDIKAIFIDEVQFLNKEDLTTLLELSVNYPILCYGLYSDFKGEPFKITSQILTFSKNTEYIFTICDICSSKATMNMKVVNGKASFSGDSISVDESISKTEYIPVCPNCFIREMIKNKE